MSLQSGLKPPNYLQKHRPMQDSRVEQSFRDSISQSGRKLRKQPGYSFAMLFPTQSMMMSSENARELSYVELSYKDMSNVEFSQEDFSCAKDLNIKRSGSFSMMTDDEAQIKHQKMKAWHLDAHFSKSCNKLNSPTRFL